MDTIKIVKIKEDITSRNNARAKFIRENLQKQGIFYLNVMSSPGSGKTTLLTKLINILRNDFKIGVIEADIDSKVDAETIHNATGVKVIQMHTMGACHVTCQMSNDALNSLGIEGLDLVILENIGNLVCPAEFDTGATKNLVLLSVPEGDDKPNKYPAMFKVADDVVITKTDALEVFDFDINRAKENILRRNPNAKIFTVSALQDENIDKLAFYLRQEILNAKKSAE